MISAVTISLAASGLARAIPKRYGGGSLALWLRADVVTVASGKVAAWSDLSGRGQGPVQATPANQPAWGATAFNGRPGITIASAGPTFLKTTSCNSLNGASGWTMFFAGQYSGAFGAQVAVSLQNQADFRGSWGTANEFRAQAQGNGSGATGETATGTWLDNTPTVLAATCDYSLTTAEIQVYKNGANVTASNSLNPNNTGKIFQTADLYIGNLDGSTRILDTGKIGEVMLFARVLKSSELSAITNYMRAFWGI